MRIDPLLTASPLTGAIRPLTSGLLADVHLVPLSSFDPSAALGSPSAPWAQSFSVAPPETTQSILRALETVARATPTLSLDELRPQTLPEGRARRHLQGLRDLWTDIGCLPEELQIWRHVIAGAQALEPLPLLAPWDCPHADVAEAALARALIRSHGEAPGTPAAMAPAPGALGHVQAHLTGRAAPVAPDDSLRLYGLRDPMEEADFAAALVQGWLDAGLIAAPAEAGLLVPDDPAYALALAEAFDRTGLPLSGAMAPDLRDPVAELASVLLPVLQGPAPRTALASVVTSPLMPWSAATGRAMARELMARGYSRNLSGQPLALALRPVASPAALLPRLTEIDGLIAPPGALRPLISLLRSTAPDWQAWQGLLAPRPLPGLAPDRSVGGVTLLTETELPWRQVRRLIVLGAQGRSWPAPQPSNPVFTEAEITQIRATGLALPGRSQVGARRLELFRRQLCAAREALVLLAPARDMAGAALPPTTGLALIARLLGANEPADLLQDPRTEGAPVAQSPRLPEAAAGSPLLPETGELTFDRSLLDLRGAAGGPPLAQSPTQLETLIVSPLAWLMGEIDARDRTWAPETLDVLTLGTLIHGVIERVFPPGPPPTGDLAPKTRAALDEVIARKAAWLADPGWDAERASLGREAVRTVQSWAHFLEASGAETLANEIALAGDHGGLLVAGRADGLLRLPDGRHVLIDHKRASSGKRRKRMELGWDLQVALYRAMLLRPTEASPLPDGAEIMTAYHTTLDGVVLADRPGLARAECPSEDPAGNALAHLADVVAEVGNGRIRLNRAGDGKRFEDERGITAYALTSDAFLAALMLPEADEEEDLDD